MKAIPLIGLCVLLGTVLGWVAASAMKLWWAEVLVFGTTFGAPSGLLLSPIILLKKKDPQVCLNVLLSFVITLPITALIAFYFYVFPSIVVTAIVVITLFFGFGFLKSQYLKRKLLTFLSLPLIICAVVILKLNLDIRLPNDEEKLIQTMGNNDEEYSFGAANKLLSYGKEPFLTGLKDKNPNVRSTSAHFLMEFKGEDVQRSLIESSKDADQYVRMWSAFSLGEVGDAKAEPILESLCKDSAEIVRIDAKEALAKIHNRAN